MNYYQRLGVSREATLKEVEQAYLTHSQEYQKESNQSAQTTQEDFAQIEKAYQVIRNHLLNAQKKQHRAGKIILLILLGVSMVALPVVLAVYLEDVGYLWLWLVFFILGVAYSSSSEIRKHQTGNSNSSYRANRAANKKHNIKSVVLVMSALVSVFILGSVLGEDNVELVEVGVEILSTASMLFGSTFILIRDLIRHTKRVSKQKE